jgi:hypothetical protein
MFLIWNWVFFHKCDVYMVFIPTGTSSFPQDQDRDWDTAML